MKTLSILCFAVLLTVPARSQNINTAAGDSTWNLVQDVWVDPSGNMFAADAASTVRKATPLGVSTIIAGMLLRNGFSGDGGPAANAMLNSPRGIVGAPDGTLFIADTLNNRIRKINPAGIISTYAGTDSNGTITMGGQATSTQIFNPTRMALDKQGNLYFIDNMSRIRKISAAGIITAYAGTNNSKITPDGIQATATDMSPGALAIAPDGSLLFTDETSFRVRKIDATGVVTTVAGNGTRGFNGDGAPATSAQLSGLLQGLTVDSLGNIYIADTGNKRIRKVGTDGIIRTYAGTGDLSNLNGDGGPATKASIVPWGMSVDTSNNLYLVDSLSGKIRKVTAPPVPAISFGSAAIPSFIGKSDFGSNMYVEIYGSNLATTARAWAGADFNGSTAPTSLDGVSVTVNNKPAFVYYVSPGQININTPDDTATGPVLIQVKNSLGLSNTGSANRARLSPTLQSVPQFNVGGKSYVVAQTPDFKSFIGRPGMVAGVPFVTAKPGDTVLIYALGCGPTNPPTQAGVVAAQNSALALPYQIRVGGVPAPVTFGGMVANSIGLYQFNVVIPPVSSGDQTIDLTVDGIPNAQNLYIVIG
jgi:uncharacterized protein (TIGR03437 family)